MLDNYVYSDNSFETCSLYWLVRQKRWKKDCVACLLDCQWLTWGFCQHTVSQTNLLETLLVGCVTRHHQSLTWGWHHLWHHASTNHGSSCRRMAPWPCRFQRGSLWIRSRNSWRPWGWWACQALASLRWWSPWNQAAPWARRWGGIDSHAFSHHSS